MSCDLGLPEHIYREKGNQFDENMKKYNEDKVNYQIRRGVSLKWELCNDPMGEFRRASQVSSSRLRI